MHHLDLNEANLLIWHAKHSSKSGMKVFASDLVPSRTNAQLIEHHSCYRQCQR